VHQFLTQVRLRRAKCYLADGLSAAEVALAVGFFDQSHLVKLFRLHFGVTPGAFIAASRPTWIAPASRR
jgi:AraC-like DNA-binding protein